MALRYSGDVEIRASWDPRERIYRASVRDLSLPDFRWKGLINLFYGIRTNPRSPEAYDRIARVAIMLADSAARRRRRRLGLEQERGQVVVRRVFQSPCPIEPSPRRRYT